MRARLIGPVLCVAGLALFVASGQRLGAASVAIYDRLPDRIDADARYVVYSHGLIVEGDDETPVSPEFGRYDFPAVKRALFEGGGFNLIAPHRPKDADYGQYVDALVSWVRQLLKAGVKPGRITLVGFSRGGQMTASASSRLAAEGINTAILAICSKGDFVRDPPLILGGRLLSMYETSDSVGSCAGLAARGHLASFKEIAISTGKSHGAFFQPLPVWMGPLKEWIAAASTQASRTAAPPHYTTPRTAWGDPDLQGIYTNKYELNTPFERPKEFEGRRIDDVAVGELSEIVKQRQAAAVYRPDGPQAFMPFRDVFEIGKGSRPWLVIDPPDGHIPPLRPEAADRATPADASIFAVNERWPVTGSEAGGPFDKVEDFSLYDRCITRGLPGAMVPHVQGNSYQIVQAPGVVAIRYELIHDTRIIPLEPSPHVGAKIRLDMGDARGHWEGDTLVVESRNFKDRSTYRNAAAGTLRLVERFTRTAAGRIEWAVTVDEPSTWTRAWTFMVPLTANNGERIFEVACHEGNRAVEHMLEGARSAEHSRTN